MTGLVVSLGLTVAALAATVWSGISRRRSLHFRLVGVFLACLGIAIWHAERLGRGLVFDGVAATLRQLHFTAVGITLALLPIMVISGVRLVRAGSRDGAARRQHRQAAWLFVLMVLVSASLGISMTVMADSR